MKYLALLLCLALLGCVSTPAPTASGDVDRERMFISTTASYFCVGNQNFLPCINPGVELASDSCTEYVVSNSRHCAEQHVYGANLASPDAVDAIGVEFAQCAMLEMLEREGVGYEEFEQCFNDHYTESAVHQSLKR